VARSFSADRKQLIPMLRAALSHRGTAIVDVISPCVTFNNHAASTKSYDYGKEHEHPIHEVGYVNPWEQPDPDYVEGQAVEVTMPDGGKIVLKKLDREYDPRDRQAAKRLLSESRESKLFLTGIFYDDADAPNQTDTLNKVDRPLSSLEEHELRPSQAVLDEVMESFR
jgi:2-oxoglutarate ferredoxin oxidoreductase subunit beta